MSRGNIRYFLVFMVLIATACQKDKTGFEFDTIVLPVQGKVRCIEPTSNGYVFAGGNVNAKGFVVESDKYLTQFNVRTESLPREVYDAKFINCRWWIGHDSLQLIHSDSLQVFYDYWWRETDWVSDLNKNPIRRLAQVGNEHFLIAGGKLAFGVVFHSSDSANSWDEFEFEHEARGLCTAGDVSNWSAWVGGDGMLIKRSKGETKWTQQEVSRTFISDIYFADLKTGWLVTYEGDVMKSVDGGESWETVCKSKTVRGANRIMSDGSNWMIVANNGAFAHSPDGEKWMWYDFEDGLDLTDVVIDGDVCIISVQDQSIQRFSFSALKN